MRKRESQAFERARVSSGGVEAAAVETRAGCSGTPVSSTRANGHLSGLKVFCLMSSWSTIENPASGGGVGWDGGTREHLGFLRRA